VTGGAGRCGRLIHWAGHLLCSVAVAGTWRRAVVERRWLCLFSRGGSPGHFVCAKGRSGKTWRERGAVVDVVGRASNAAALNGLWGRPEPARLDAAHDVSFPLFFFFLAAEERFMGGPSVGIMRRARTDALPETAESFPCAGARASARRCANVHGVIERLQAQ